MIVLEYDHVEVDFCVSCKGVWLDAGEIELLFGDAQACREVLKGGERSQAKTEKTRRCPICRRKMGKAVSGGKHGVTYDCCPAGDGLWFDEGELNVVLSESAAFAHKKIAAFLGDVFSEGPERNGVTSSEEERRNP
jgi:hypothetical protein